MHFRAVCSGFLWCLYNGNPLCFKCIHLQLGEDEWNVFLPVGIWLETAWKWYETSCICCIVCLCVKAEVKWCQFQSISGWNVIKWRHIYTPNLEKSCFVVLESEHAWLCGCIIRWSILSHLGAAWSKSSSFLNFFYISKIW